MIPDSSPLLPTYASYAFPIVGRLGIPIATNLYEVSPDMMTCTKGPASGVSVGDPLARIRAINAHIRSGIEVVVRHVRGTGLLLSLKVKKKAVALKAYLVDRHILIGRLGNPGVLRLMPPLNVSNEAIDALLSAVNEFTAHEVVA
jgi:acetylornithine/succinyldiaminopimelate/putrescine aminotransferase